MSSLSTGSPEPVVAGGPDASGVLGSKVPSPVPEGTSFLTTIARIRFLSHSLSGASWVLGPLLIYKTTSSLQLAALLLALEWILRAAFSFGIASFLDRFAPSKTFRALEWARAMLFFVSAALFMAPALPGLAYVAFAVQLMAQVAYTGLQTLTEAGVTQAAKLDKKPIFLGQTQVRSSELIAACTGSAFLAVLGLFHVPAAVTCLLLSVLSLNCGYWSAKSLTFLDTEKRPSLTAHVGSSLESTLPVVKPAMGPAALSFVWGLSLVTLALNVPLAVFWSSLSFWFASSEVPLATVLKWVASYKFVENLLAATWMYTGSRYLSQQRLTNLSVLGWLIACALGVWLALHYDSGLPLWLKFLFPICLSSSILFLNQALRTYRQSVLRGPRKLRMAQHLRAFEMLSYPLAALVLYVWGYANPWIFGFGVLGAVGLVLSRRRLKSHKAI